MKNISFKALMLSVALILSGGLCAQGQLSDTYTFSENGFENAEKVTSIEIGDISVVFSKAEGSTDPAYYNSGTALRLYMHNTMTFSAPDGAVISGIDFALAGGNWNLSEVTPSTGDAEFSFEEQSGNWTGSAQDVTFTLGDKIDDKSTQLRIVSITVTYTPGQVAVERPVATPAAGFYTEPQNVTLTCATEGATIYYTLDGKEPTAASTEYTAPISISKTTTLKAIAIKGEDISSVLTADYALPVDVADIAALIANEAGSTYYRVTGALTVLYHGEGRIFVTDAAGSRLLIYDRERNIETTYANGQTLTGVIGQLTDDSQGKVLSPYLPMPEAGEGTAVAPVKKTPEAISEADMYAYVSISGAVAASAWDGSEAAIKVGENGTLTLYNQFKLSDELVAGSAYDIEAIVSQYKGNLQLLPIKITESAGSAVRPVSVKGVEAYSADGVLYVSAAVGDRIEVYSLLGSLLYNAPAADAVTAIEGLPQSVVIVRVGRAATKVVVR